MRWLTFGIMIGITVLLIAWDIFVYATDGTHATISAWFYWLGYHPVIPFAFGVLLGHFWPVYGRRPRVNHATGTHDA